MKLGNFLKFSVGLVAGAILFGASAQAAPVPPVSVQVTAPAPVNVQPAVVSQNEVDQAKPMQVRWHGHHHGWHHRHWGHRHWHRHHWHHRHWHHRHW
jgi:hypothetical protein